MNPLVKARSDGITVDGAPPVMAATCLFRVLDNLAAMFPIAYPSWS
jgi:hypothetical protein